MFLLNKDVLENILEQFSYPELSCLRRVSKQFNDVASALYRQKHAAMRSESSKLYFEYLAEMSKKVDMRCKAVCLTKFVDRFVAAKCWPVLIECPSLREGLFFLCATYHPYGTSVHISDYDAIHDRIRPYMFLNSTQGLDTDSMRKLLRYKRTPRVSKMSRRQLQSKLLAPKYKSFLWECC